MTPVEEEPDLSNLDRWYQRDAGEIVGKFKLYRVALRDEKAAEPVRVSDALENRKTAAATPVQ